MGVKLIRLPRVFKALILGVGSYEIQLSSAGLELEEWIPISLTRDILTLWEVKALWFYPMEQL